jgi:uracil-DNA glycosylase family 4
MQALRVAEGCERCPVLAANRRCIVHGYGSSTPSRDAPPVFLVGEAPGYKGGDLSGVPFTRDRSGVRLQRVLIELGLSEETDPRLERPRLRCFVSNVVRCNPPANRTPTRAEINNCLPYLWQELEIVRPRIVVPLGNVAARAIFPRLLGQPAAPITQIHAQVFGGDGLTVVPLRHTARISNADLARFVSVMRELLGFPPYPGPLPPLGEGVSSPLPQREGLGEGENDAQ